MYGLLEGKVPQQEFLTTDRWLSNEACLIYCQLLGQIQYPAKSEHDKTVPVWCIELKVGARVIVETRNRLVRL